ncbi:MAG: RsmB/NOP family class I SAM-dependent RNA methyltransferase [Rhizobiaceae bacterium]|nr:RsmB/NOP family class I SAM-dependent RNA methyltransferase [Rhizobiaceae bacterium]
MGAQPDRPEAGPARSLVVSDLHGGGAQTRTKNRNTKRAERPADPPGLPARRAAARLLAAVVDAHTSLDGLTDAEHGHPQFRALDERDRALVRAILVSGLRFRGTIAALIADRLDRPLPANATTLAHILHVAAAQILFLDVPDSAAVDLAVDHAKSDPRTARFSGLVNGLLRNLVREKVKALPAALAATVDAPGWFADRLIAAYGTETAGRIMAAHRHEPPVDFTVRSDPQEWARKLGGAVLPTGSVRLAVLPGPVAELPGYRDGAWWVQDAAASLPARLFGDIAGLRVADLCAAPGGKTAQLALAGAHVTAIDSSQNRVDRLSANLQRLGLRAEVVRADMLQFEPPALYDAVLLDAPCSSTGTVRRHPDVPWTKSPQDVEKLAELQERMLVRALTLVTPGGRLVLSNCSLDPREGEDLRRRVLAALPELADDPLRPGELPFGDRWLTPEGTLRTTPSDLDLGDPAMSGMDGFFAARFRRL